MRIVIAGLWAATEPSGICRTVVSLIRGLNEITPRLDLTLVIGKWQQEYFETSFEIGRANVQIVRPGIGNRSADRNWWYLFGLPRLAYQIRADVVHLSFPAPVLRTLFNCPIVTTLHDLYPYDCPKNFGYPRVLLNRVALRRSLLASDLIACVSEFTLSRLSTVFPKLATKSSCIGNPIVATSSRTEDSPLIEGPYVLAVAQHRANKNLELLLRSFHQFRLLADADGQTKLVIVGMRGPETPGLYHLVDRLGLGESVLFLANIKDSELAALYRNCDLFVTLSTIEGFGLPVGEALAHGARVIASDIPAHRSIGGDHCEYVSLSDDNLVRRIAESLRCGGRRPKIVRETHVHLTTRQSAEQYLALYKAARHGITTQPQHSTSTSSA